MRKADSGTLRAAALAALAALVLAEPARAGDGHVIYRQVCAACHATGVAGAPRLGDREAWGIRLRAGRAAMVTSVLRGKGQMPPKGGNVSLSDEDVKAALDYMLEMAR